VPYFPYTKHFHLIMSGVNFLTKPKRTSLGAPGAAINFEDETIEKFGVAKLEELPWTHLVDAYSCIMCNRCQDVCPAYTTGKELSPSALEVNKRYYINANSGVAGGKRLGVHRCSTTPSANRRCGPARPAAPAWTSARWATSRCSTSCTFAATRC
jgi:ferredoxin